MNTLAPLADDPETRRVAALVDSIDGIVWEADAQSLRLTFVSAQAERILGYPRSDWYAEGFWEAHIHPDDRQRARRCFLESVREEGNHVFEYRMLARDGSVLWLKNSVNVAIDCGRTTAVRGIMVDISAQKQAQQAAAEQAHFFEQLGDSLPSPIFWKDAQGYYRGCNKAFEEYIGIPRAGLIGKSVHDIAPAELAKVYEEADRALFAQRGVQTYEAGVRYHDGSRHNVTFYKATFQQKDGSVGGLVGIMLDITDRKRMEDELRLSGTVFENSTQGILLTDGNCRILKVNPSFCEITGYQPEDVLGRTPAILKSGRQNEAFYEAMWKVIDEEGRWSGEMWNRRKNGEIYAEHLSITRVPDENGGIANYIGIFNDISNYKAAQLQIEQMAFFDAMTGLPNRALLHDRLQHALIHAERHRRRVALLVIDLDRLAHINDTLGHHVGDRLLIAVADRLRSVAREADTVSRHIGDEFAVIMEELGEEQAATDVADRLLRELALPFLVDTHEITITACIGISIFPEDGNTPEKLIKHADVALHHAKNCGMGCAQFFREEMNHASMERLLIESSLRQALQRNEFRLFYQPQVELASGRIVGMEALVRWQHPDMGMVSPARFIPIAEETGQIVEIGIWVLREACMQTQAWQEKGFKDLRVAVNVSAQQFNTDDFAEQVQLALRDTGLAPDRLELELTESMIMQQPERVVGVMTQLRALGVKFSIDDFGTGYSSLSQLKRFPIDKLKIDQSFTQDIGVDESGTAITQAIIALGHSMRLHVVAEGVETGEQQRFLIQNGCHSMQGYLFSRPLPAADFTELLERHACQQLESSWHI